MGGASAFQFVIKRDDVLNNCVKSNNCDPFFNLYKILHLKRLLSLF